MHRTIKLPYVAPDPCFRAALAELRCRQSRIIRTAYCRLVDGLPQKQLYQTLRIHPVGRAIHSWLVLSAMTKAKSLFRLHPEGDIVFGGRRRLVERSQGKITAEQWRAHRLSPLVIEGHARSHGPQGGNNLVTIDAINSRLILHGPNSTDYVLQLKLSGRSKTYRKRLLELQIRCEIRRDIPFSVSLTETEVALTWDPPEARLQPEMNSNRILSLDLNPNRIGWTVVEKAGVNRARCIAWGIFEFPDINRRLRVASSHPTAIAQNHKRRHELSLLAKKLVWTARHYGARTTVTERLRFPAKDSGRGHWFNRLVNQCWFRRGFLQPLARHLGEAGLEHAEVNPAYSSLIGNFLWADAMNIPDPACAALELGRRFFNPISFMPGTLKHLPEPNADHQRKDGLRVDEQSATLGGWSRVWRTLNPSAHDTLRRARRSLHAFLPFGLPRRLSVREQRSRVLHFDPRPGASDAFGFDFSLLFSG
jgi:hypothetical protein